MLLFVFTCWINIDKNCSGQIVLLIKVSLLLVTLLQLSPVALEAILIKGKGASKRLHRGEYLLRDIIELQGFLSDKINSESHWVFQKVSQ
jgi:hypothetical protein